MRDRIYVRSCSFGRFISEDVFATAWQRRAKGPDQLLFYAANQWQEGKLFVKLFDGSSTGANDFTSISISSSSVLRVETTGSSLFIHLAHPPTYASHSGETVQLGAIDEAHAAVRSPSTILRIELHDEQTRRDIMGRATDVGLPRVISSRIRVRDQDEGYAQGSVDAVGRWLGRLDVRVAFQLDALLSNGILSYQQVDSLGDAVVEVVRSQGAAEAERILVLFALKLASEKEPADERDEDAAALGGQQHNLQAGKKRQHDDEDDDDEDEDEPLGTLHERPSQHPSHYTIDELLVILVDAAADAEAAGSPFARLDQSVLARSVTITPSRMLLQGPSYDESNALLREYGAPQHFIRVCVRLDDLSLLRDRTSHIIDTRLLPLFNHGIVIAGRRFEFLAYSSSQLRSHACFFVEPFHKDGVLVNAESIRSKLGDFSELMKQPAKWMARVGQSLSSSRTTVVISKHQIRCIPDIVSSTGSVHTDGVGLVSSDLAADIVRATGGLKTGQRAPTTWQFRLGGAKGMLQLDPTLKKKELHLRPSQIKFPSTSTSLAIVQSFVALPAFLNRPLVLILSSLGAPDSAFLKLQRRAVKMLQLDGEGSVADTADVLRRMGFGVGGGTKFVEMLAWLGDLQATNAPGQFVTECISIALGHCAREIKHRARIPLPGCYNLVGCSDHSGFLAEGEVYICLHKPGETKEWLEGTIGISRSPTMHPGDVQLVRAVGRIPPHIAQAAPIQGLTNCVVFSSRGNRSLPSKLAGGDLDGDLYLVMTKKSGLLPKRGFLPASYEAPPATHRDTDCSIREEIDFFFQYIAEDNIGQIATRHLLLADHHREGCFHSDCLRLAELHSDAVDFVKSGTSVGRDKLPRAPKAERPDFLGGNYPSPRILGQLYRAFEIDDRASQSANPGTCSPIDPRRSLTKLLLSGSYPGLPGNRLSSNPSPHLVDYFTAFLRPFGRELRKLGQLVSTIHAPSEAEMFMGLFMGKKGRVDRSESETSARLRDRTGELFSLLRREVVGAEDQSTPEVIERIWAAWWAALEAAEKGDQTPLGVRSFGLIVLSLLGEWLKKLEIEQKTLVID